MTIERTLAHLSRSDIHRIHDASGTAGDTATTAISDRALQGSGRARRALARMIVNGDLPLPKVLSDAEDAAKAPTTEEAEAEFQASARDLYSLEYNIVFRSDRGVTEADGLALVQSLAGGTGRDIHVYTGTSNNVHASVTVHTRDAGAVCEVLEADERVCTFNGW